jgi:hypothetical protein
MLTGSAVRKMRRIADARQRMMTATEDLLRRLAASDESCLRTLLSLEPPDPAPLGRRTRALVQLSALLAVGAATTSVRWAAELAATTGADEGTIVQVLLATAAAAGSVQTVKSAPRLALALDLDVGE